MSLFEDAMAIAVQLSTADRERLAQALGVKSAPTFNRGLPLHQATARPDPVAWRKAETGHAVLATGDAAAPDAIPAGPVAIAGVWEHRRDEYAEFMTEHHHAPHPSASSLPAGTPTIVHTDVAVELGLGVDKAVSFFERPPVEIRLATASYLALLSICENEGQLNRIRRFVQPYAVLSLGPMASSRSVELMMRHGLHDGLAPLDAFIAATALAHEIPLITVNPTPFAHVEGLTVCVPYS